MTTYDVAIIGAGVLGAAIARELSHYELAILWLEKAGDVATGITRGNTSIVHSGFDDARGSVKSRYSPQGAALFEELDRELRFGFLKCGSLVVALNNEEQPRLEALLANGQNNGVRGLELWGREQLLEREPKLNPEACFAMYAPKSGVVIAPEFCIALAENAVANGAELHLNEKLRATHAQSSGGYTLETARGSYRCRYLVNAAGWGAAAISDLIASNGQSSKKKESLRAGLDYELEAVKGQYLVFDRSCGQLVKHVLFPLPDKKKGKGVTVCPTYHGNLLLGPDAEIVAESWEQTEKISDLSTQLERLQGIYRQGLRLVPGIPHSKVIRSYAGMRPRLKRLNPSLCQKGEVPYGDFLIHYRADCCELLGIASPGLSSAPAIAREMAEKLAVRRREQGQSWYKKNHFLHERTPYISSQRDKVLIPVRELKHYTELPLNDPECLICRCEQVKSSTIQQTLRRFPTPLGDGKALASNLDFIKWRTRATMGFCQGQFCKPRLRSLLAELMQLDVSQIVEAQGRDWPRVSAEVLRRELS